MINKQSNVYTIVYITVMVIVVGAALAFTSMALKDRQNENAQADKKSQILQAVHIPTTRATVIADFEKYITSQLVVNSNGDEIEGTAAFDVDVAAQISKPVEDRLLPVYVCTLADVGTKYIVPLYGMGLWGPIWGYIAFNADGTTIYGAFFDHQGETPGLGAEITKPVFTDQFVGRQVFKGTEFLPIEVVKAGQKPSNPNADYVDGVSGGTITSKGVGAMFDNCLSPYRAWLEKIGRGGNFNTLGSEDLFFSANGEGDAQITRRLSAEDLRKASDRGGDIHATVEGIEKAERVAADQEAIAEETLTDTPAGQAVKSSVKPARKLSAKTQR